MNSAREKILTRLKQAPRDANSTLPLSPLTAADDNATATAEDVRSLFIERCIENRIEVYEVRNETWLDQLNQIAAHKQLHRWLLGTNLKLIDQAEQALTADAYDVFRYEPRVEQCKDYLFDKIDASLTLAEGAIAETGTLILKPTANEPRLMSLIPEVHVVLLSAQQVLSSLQEYVASAPSNMPTNLLFISSPSKTADIQQTLAYGAHGPKELIVLLKD